METTNPSLTFDEMIEQITPDMHANLQRTVQLGRFADGRRLTREQQADLLHTLMAWEAKNLPEDQRSGFLPQLNCGSSKKTDSTPKSGLGYYDPNAK